MKTHFPSFFEFKKHKKYCTSSRGADAEPTDFVVFNICRYSVFFRKRNTDVETSVSVLVWYWFNEFS